MKIFNELDEMINKHVEKWGVEPTILIITADQYTRFIEMRKYILSLLQINELAPGIENIFRGIPIYINREAAISDNIVAERI